MDKKLRKLRKRIDEIDESIVRLLEERVKVVHEVGRVKAKEGRRVYDAGREQEVLDHVSKAGGLEPDFVRNLYRSIIAYCRSDEKAKARKPGKAARAGRREVAVLGPAGTFTESAAQKFFGNPKLKYHDTAEDVFKAVETGTPHGVAAIENSLEGSVGKTMECLMEYDVYITGEIVLDISLCLMTKGPSRKITRILSHPHALAQCRGYLKKQYPKIKLESSDSTAAAMREAADNPGYAAIGPEEAASRYGLKVIAKGIQNDFSQTRFVVLGRRKRHGDKTSIIFAVKDEPGALHGILKAFAERGINLTKIESRPSKRRLGEYLFFMDFESPGMSARQVQAVLTDIKPKTTLLKSLGSY